MRLDSAYVTGATEEEMTESIEQIYHRCKEANWDGDGALPITRETAAGALMLMNGLRSAGLDSVAMPEPDGMIEFEFYEEPGRVVSMSIDNTPKVYWAAHDGTQSIGHGVLTVSEAIEQLPGIVRETLGK